MTTTKRPPRRAKSGEFPEVKAFRRKLDSLSDGAEEALRKLDLKIDGVVTSIRPPPPDPADEEDEEPTTPGAPPVPLPPRKDPSP